MSYLILVAGLIVLLLGGELMVRGAVNIAYRFRVSALVVGMTIVSFGTSAPELLVSLQASIDGYPDIAIGNVIGSNIANLALVLGLTALILPIEVSKDTLYLDWPAMMVATIVTFLFMIDGQLVFYEGCLMFVALLGYTVFLIRRSRIGSKEEVVNEDESKLVKSNLLRDVSYIVIGCAGLALGSDWLVQGAVEISRSFGVSDLVISVTVVAFGTSAPELMTSLVAAIRKQSDISIGNLIGSNLFNLFSILGITSMVKSIPINDMILNRDMWWVLGISFIIFPMMLLGRRVGRLKGLFLFSAYIIYVSTIF